MSEYKHGAYGNVQAAGAKVSAKSRSAIVYVGTAPVHTIAGGAKYVNTPVLVTNIADARKKLGYNSDWAKYTLCEAMYTHLEKMGIGPLVFINVLDPAVHKSAEAGTVTQKPVKGRITITNAADIILDSVTLPDLAAGTDYAIAYDDRKETIVIRELVSGALGESEIQITYSTIDAEKVTEAAVIGANDGDGLCTGLAAIRNVYQLTGYIPSFLVAPGFSSIPAVHDAMYEASQKINGHWNAYMMTDMPITHDGKALTLSTAAEWKEDNGYNMPNETVSFPLIKGTDGLIHHMSVLRAATLQQLLLDQDGIPYKSASNVACDLIENLYLGEEASGRVYDDELINEKLNSNGIASAAYVGGRWALWGAHCADYTAANEDMTNVAETSRMMLYYITNDYQHRRMRSTDQPMTANDLRTIVAEEQARLDALIKIGALTYGEVTLDATADDKSDIMLGNFAFSFRVTAMPLGKSLTANVYVVEDGFAAYIASFE